jgi:hypothetical protein
MRSADAPECSIGALLARCGIFLSQNKLDGEIRFLDGAAVPQQ